MSKATELAKAEADRAEVEQPEPETPDVTETPAETENPAGSPEVEIDEEGEEAEHDEQGEPGETPAAPDVPPSSLTISDELNAKREAQAKSQARNIERLADEYGQDVTECPVCGNVDLAALIVARMSDIPAEGWAMLGASVGAEPEPDHAMAEGVVMCDRCNGFGELDYPTRNPHMARQNCPKCQGNGYTLDQAAEPPTAPVFTFPTPQTPPPPAFAPPGPVDPWGRPTGHPHYGLDPAAVMP